MTSSERGGRSLADSLTGPQVEAEGHSDDGRSEGSGRPASREPEGLLLAVAVAGLAAGAGLHLAGMGGAGNVVWAATTMAGVVPATWWVIDAARHRRLGADVIAVLALVGTLVVGEYLAGAVIAVMLASGRTLEAWAAARSRRELRAAAQPGAPGRAPPPRRRRRRRRRRARSPSAIWCWSSRARSCRSTVESRPAWPCSTSLP